MAVTTFVYLGAKRRMEVQTLDWVGDELKMMLIGDGYTPDARDTVVGTAAGTIGGEEIVVDGYTGGFGGVGRKVVTGKAVTKDGPNLRIIFDCNDVDFGILGGGVTEAEVAAGVIVDEKTSDADSQPVFYVKFPKRFTDGTTFEVLINPDGVIYLQISETV